MNTISIIVPIYNSSEYLDRCVESIVSQTYKDLEILLVDDGSTDNSLKMCNDWAKKDNRIVVLHQENGGQGSARNMALDVAKGQYIAFVDSDDWISKDMFQILYHNMKVHNADISCCNNGTVGEVTSGDIKIFEQPGIMWEHLQHHKGTGHSPCDKLYKKILFDGVRYNELRAYEDCATVYRIFHNAKKMVWEDTTLYYYTSRPNSTMTSSFSSVKYQAIDAYLQMYQDYTKWNPVYAYKVKEYLFGSIQFCIGETLIRNKKNEYNMQYNRALSIAQSIGSDGLPFKSKMLLFLICRMPLLYRVLYKIFKH